MKNVHIFCVRSPDASGKGDQVIYNQRCEQFSSMSDVQNVNIYCLDKRIKNYRPNLSKVTTHHVKSNIFYRAVMFAVLLIFKRMPIQSSVFYSSGLVKIARNIDKNDIIVIGTVRLMYLLKVASTHRCILDMIDIMSKTFGQIGLSSRNPLKRYVYQFEARRLAYAEKRATQINKLNLLVSEYDGKEQHLVHSNVYTIPIMSKGLSKTGSSTSADCATTTTVGFHGNLDYLPNAEACRFILTEVMPKVQSMGVKFVCTGRRPKADLVQIFKRYSKDAQIIESPVDIFSIVSTFDIYLAPIFKGAGMQNKLIEAAELEVPIVTTQKAALPLGFENLNHCLIAEDAAEFCEAISMLLKDPNLRRRLTANAYKKINSIYSLSSVTQSLEKVLGTSSASI